MTEGVSSPGISVVTTEAQLEMEYEKLNEKYLSLPKDAGEDAIVSIKKEFDDLKKKAKELGVEYLKMVDRISARKK